MAVETHIGLFKSFGPSEVRGYIPSRARLYSRKSAVIFSEERGYISGCWKSAVIFLQ